MRKLVISDKFVEALRDAGIIHEYERVSRVIIDCKVGHPPLVYVVRIGDERLVDVVASGGFEIVERS